MTEPVSHEKRFESRRAEMAAIGYYLFESEYGSENFISSSGNQIEAEDVLLADWPNWRALFRKAKAEV